MLQKIVVRGITIAAEFLQGRGDLIVFIHGVGADRTSWKFQLPYFNALGYSVVALDMRGSGDSDSRDVKGRLLPISLHEFASDVDAVIKSLGFNTAHWVGNSMGGVIILEALCSNPDSLSSIVLCNTFAKHPESDVILPRAGAALAKKTLQEFATERIPLVLRPDIDTGTLTEATLAMARKDPEAYLASWQSTWSPDFRSTLGTIRKRCLVVSGSLDMITPVALSEELAANIPGARHIHIEGAGHISNLDKPDEFNEVLNDFLARNIN